VDTLVDDALLIELARPVVAETVPVETELYALLAADYLEKQGTAGRRKPAIGPLAFGLPERRRCVIGSDDALSRGWS